MTIKIIKTEKEYKIACNRIYELMQESESAIEPGTPEGDELELLAMLVEKHEKAKHTIGVPNPIEAIKFRMEQMNLKQADIAPLFGGKTRVSEVLNGKRRLNLKMITLLNRYLGIPLESLIEGKNIRLETDKRNKILKVASIRNYFTHKNDNLAMASEPKITLR